MAREINLVPDIKGEMIKALKLRNLTFFICIIVASASILVSLVLAGVAGGQQAIADGKKNTIDTLSQKLNAYTNLDDFLTIKDQLGNLSAITNNKKTLSRTFDILQAIIPTGPNTITISELNIDLSSAQPTISFDAQANSNEPPYIDYTVLDSFKKSMQYMRYDYGEYVDKNGATIPAYCIVDTDINGTVFYDQANSSYYAYWLIAGDGCNPSYTASADDTIGSATEIAKRSEGYTTETYDGQTVVRIWRTPQFDEWYKDEKKDNQPYMSLNGTIANVPHFESKCITYTGVKNTTNAVTWTSSNESCLLVPAGSDGINVSGSSNGRSSSSELVLRFSATITLSPEIYKFTNHHVLAFGPTGRHNVTDSYVQIQGMFEKRALDCADGDSACNNANGGNN